MDEQNTNSNIADAAVSDIHKDFVVVGKHRVHSWYAWAIVGIVFGMALGIVYVANRSNQSNQNVQFTQSQAATANPKISPIGVVSFTPIYKSNKADKFVGTTEVPVIAGVTSYDMNKYRAAWVSTPNGTPISAIMNLPNSDMNVIGRKGNLLYMGVKNSNGITVSATGQPYADLSKEVTYTFKGVHITGEGNKKVKTDVTVVGTFVCAVDLGKDCNRYTPTRTIGAGKQSLKMPEGIPPVLFGSFQFINNKGVLKTAPFPSAFQRAATPFLVGGGTFTVVFKDGVVKKIVKGTDITAENIQEADASLIPPQCKTKTGEGQDECIADLAAQAAAGTPVQSSTVTQPALVIPTQCQGIRSTEGKEACAEQYYADQAAAASRPATATPAKTPVEIQCEARFPGSGENIDACVEAGGNY